MIQAKGLTKRFGSRITAVDALDLEVSAGEVFGFLGPNGAGKTTTLRMLLGLARPTAGSACVAGHPPGDPRGLRRIGSVVETPAFYPYLSGRDNLTVLAHYCGARRAAIDAALEVVGLTSRAKDSFKTYSMGMKQRLGVAAALLKEPDLFILDEPTNGLDPAGMVEMRGLIRDLGRDGRTVLISSHLLAEVEQICGRVAVIQKGRLVAQGSVDELRGEAGLLVRAQPGGRARELLERVLGPGVVAADGEVIRLKVPAERAAGINRELVQAGIDVSELRPAERSLEEIFLQLTGEEVGA